MSPPVLLCIDDRAPLLQLRKSMLEEHGYAVVTADDAVTAITRLGTAAIAAVILEYKSEGMDAEAIAWLIKKRFPTTPIVLLSAYSDIPERVLWLVDEYVMRSEPREGLLRAIARVASAPRVKIAGAAA